MTAIGMSQAGPKTRAGDRRVSYSDEVLAAVDSGRTIEAIKRLREETGLGLKEAKDAVDALARDRRGSQAAAANMPEEGGAGSVVKIVIAIVIVLAAYFYFFAP